MVVRNTTKKLELKGVEVASNIFQLTRGLMFRNEGSMLLDFGVECKPGIWMLFMRYPLMLAFVSADGEVKGVVKHAPPITFDPRTWKVFYPPTKIRYVLEVDVRAVERGEFNADVGDVLEFLPS